MYPANNLIGRRFGKLVVTGFAGYLSASLGAQRAATWTCTCDCGQIKRVNTSNLVNGATRSCGCIRRKRRSRKYLYSKWYYEKNKGNLCEDWLSYEVFKTFMGKVGYTDRMKIVAPNKGKVLSPNNFCFK